MVGRRDTAPRWCEQCGAQLAPDALFCPICGVEAGTRRFIGAPGAGDVPAGRTVRAAAFVMDLAAIAAPIFPLAIAGAVLDVAAVLTVVTPLACAAVWLWMQLWLALMGRSLGKTMLGLRLVSDDDRLPGLPRTVARSLIFAVTLGAAALPMMTSSTPRDGLHDRLTGLRVLDVVAGDNPLDTHTRAAFRRST
ncbi:MAG: RDD family protein [Mycobacterium sp.]|nr:RDD family protein [Mycobacterium sp.]